MCELFYLYHYFHIMWCVYSCVLSTICNKRIYQVSGVRCPRFLLFTARCYVCPPVRLSVRDVEVSWSPKLEYFENNSSVRQHEVFALSRPQHGGSNRNFGRDMRGVWKMWLSAYKSSNISKTWQDRTKVILLRTNRKSHICFPLVPKSTTSNDLYLMHFISQHVRLSMLTMKVWMKTNLHFQRRSVAEWFCSWQYKVYANIRRVPWRGAVKRQWGDRK